MSARIGVVAALVAVGLSGCSSAGTSTPSASGGSQPNQPSVASTAGRAATDWEYQPGFRPTASATELRVVVWWRGCASGAAPLDPQPAVSYSAEHVTLTVWAIPPPGSAFDCQGNARVDLTVPLSEPLGSRDVTQGATTIR